MHKYRPLIILFAILAASYAAEMILIPAGYNALSRYHLGAENEKILGLVMLLPTMAVWSVALFAFIHFRHYAKTIAHTKDGKPLLHMANGMLGLALWLPLVSILNNLTSYIYHVQPSTIEEVVIAKNYLIVLVLCIAFFAIWQGTRQLVRTLPRHNISPWFETLYRVTFVVVCIMYAVLIVHEPYRSAAPSTGLSAFYLPDWLIAFTIMLPYVCIWYMGLFSVRNISIYRKHVKGVLYKEALKYLCIGLTVLIVAVLANRFIYILTSWFNDLAMKYVLIILYALLGLAGVGSILIAQGAKKLRRIEEA